ncbi:hypothetical protein [Profundibacter sp.]
MLSAAMPKTDRALETVRLVLTLEVKDQKYPETLKSYLKKVIEQTIALLETPEKSASSAMPEAVSLAVMLSSNEDFQAAIRNMLDGDEISHERAEAALNSLEAGFDPAREPAHFSKEIYAAI